MTRTASLRRPRAAGPVSSPRRTAVLLVAGALAVTMLVAPGRARADDKVIGLLDVRVEGVSDAAAEVFAKQLEESLGISGFQVAPRARLLEFLAGTPWNAACLIGACLKELDTHAGVATVIEATLVGMGPSYHYVITLLDTKTGRPLGQLARSCDVCTTEEAFSAAALTVVELVNEVGDAAPEPTPIKVPPRPQTAAKGRKAVRRAGLAFLGAAVLAGAGGAYLISRDKDSLGAGTAGAAGAFAVAGFTCLGVSFSF